MMDRKIVAGTFALAALLFFGAPGHPAVYAVNQPVASASSTYSAHAAGALEGTIPLDPQLPDGPGEGGQPGESGGTGGTGEDGGTGGTGGELPQRRVPVLTAENMTVRLGSAPVRIPVTTDSDGALLFLSDHPEVASIAEDGTITPASVGAAVITIAVPETVTCQAASITITVTVTTSFDPPSLSSAAYSDQGLSLRWQRLKGLLGYAKTYTLWRMDPGADWKKIAEISDQEPGQEPDQKPVQAMDRLSYEDTDVRPGIQYYYRLQAEGDPGDVSPFSSEEKAAWMAAPAGVVTEISYSGNLVRWQLPEGAEGCRIYRKVYSSGGASSWKKVKTVTHPTMTEWLDRGAENGQTQKYRVRATCGIAFGKYSSSVKAKRLAVPEISGNSGWNLSWKPVSGAAGYETETSRSSLFLQPVLTDFPGASASSGTAKAAYKKGFVRIRAYRTSGIQKIYSPWSQAIRAGKAEKRKNVRLTMKETVKVPWKNGGKYATKLKKKKIKVPYELRTKAKQVMYQYDTVQGGCSDGTYGYFILYRRTDGSCRILKIRLKTGARVRVSKTLPIRHGNSMTWDGANNRLVATSEECSYRKLVFVDPNTLEAAGSKTVTLPADTCSATGKFRSSISGMSGIAWDASSGRYAVGIAGGKGIAVLDRDFNLVRWFSVPADYDSYFAGMYANADAIYVGRFPKPGTHSGQRVDVYRWDGEKAASYSLTQGYELENIYPWQDRLQACVYASRQRTFSKPVRKKIRVKVTVKSKKTGKKKKKTVSKKIWVTKKYTSYVRDNYIYRLEGL